MAGALTTDSLFSDPLLLLGAAVLAVPLFKRLGLGSVLGYLAAGIVIGPILSLITDGREILHVAELGVVLLLFIVGLELKPSRLWGMRRDIFGLGILQVLACGAALMGLVYMSGQSWQASTVVGLGLALSSTAIAMQILDESGEIAKPYGQKSFSILLFQDLAIVPLLALVAFLSPQSANAGEAGNWTQALIELAKIVGAVVALVLAGRYFLNPLFRLLARAKAREIMTAAALLVVLGAAALMEFAGMSSAMGAFLAGVMLAESSFRHELEANIEPFRGLLLGLFFMAVGMSLDLGIVAENWLLILLAAPIFMLVKAVIIYGAARLFAVEHRAALKTAMLLPQHGEFAFVLFTSATASGLLSNNTASVLMAIVTVTMALTPLSLLICAWLLPAPFSEEMEEDFEGAGGSVILVSFGRFGQVVSQLLLAQGVDVTIIDNNAERIRSAAKFGFKVYYGDGRRLEVLRAAGLDNARMVVVCADSAQIIELVVELLHKHAPLAKIYTRSYDRSQSIAFRRMDIEFEIRETLESAIKLGAMALKGLGVEEERVAEIEADVRKRDEMRLNMQVEGDIDSGRDMLHQNLIKPEPLRDPKRSAKVLNEKAGQALRQDSSENTPRTAQPASTEG